MGVTLLPRPTLLFCETFERYLDFDISLRVRGVLLLTRLDGLQYGVLLLLEPHGFPDWSFHFSLPQRFRAAPLAVLRTVPFFLRHLAIACEARAEGNTLYRLLTE